MSAAGDRKNSIYRYGRIFIVMNQPDYKTFQRQVSLIAPDLPAAAI